MYGVLKQLLKDYKCSLNGIDKERRVKLCLHRKEGLNGVYTERKVKWYLHKRSVKWYLQRKKG